VTSRSTSASSSTTALSPCASSSPTPTEGPLHSRKGINLPDSDVSAPAITEYDWKCVDWAIEHKLEYLALSFVRSAKEIIELKDYLRKADSGTRLIAKIEKPQALDHLDDIITASDAIMVARGDLGIEMDIARVPLIQKQITALCRRFGKPVIVATQILQSMINSATPTRAEVSDISNAIMDFADALMLSGETAVGKFPVEAVRYCMRIARQTEEYLEQSGHPRPRIETSDDLISAAAVARTVAQIVEDIRPKLVLIWSQSGAAARLFSKARIDVPVIAFSADQRCCRQMNLHYGVTPICIPVPKGSSAFIKAAEQLVIQNNWAQLADRVVLVTAPPLIPAGTSNAILLHTISAT